MSKKMFLAILTMTLVATIGFSNPVTSYAGDTLNPSGSSSNNSAPLPKGFKSYKKLKRKTRLEKKAYKNCKIMNRYAKKHKWKTRGFKRLSSTKRKVVTEMYLSGKSRGKDGFWTFRVKIVQHKTKGVYFVQDGKRVSDEDVFALIRDPQKYYSK